MSASSDEAEKINERQERDLHCEIRVNEMSRCKSENLIQLTN